MNMKMRYIRATCWIGIVVDFLWAMGLFYPSLFILLTGKTQIVFDFQMRLIMAVAGALMLGWTFLLLWTVQNPIERRMVLLLTAFPVVFGIFIVTCISVVQGNSYSIWITVKTFLIFILLISSYFSACKLSDQMADARS